MAESSRRSFPINITDCQGQHRPVASVGLSMLSFGTWGGAFAAVVGPIPYAIDGAIRARPGLRLPASTTISEQARHASDSSSVACLRSSRLLFP
ncbi:hypothetical protein DFH06DRAFT_1484381 [Mycena polygramma]|nr:hypothetical protein DFH06DRAFT_1484381 [Mycena polygramma]